MARAKVHRHLERPQQLLGLEVFDLLALASVLWVVIVVVRASLLIDAAVGLVAYAALRLAKRGRPPGHTASLFRYALRSRRAFLSASAPDELGRRSPFAPTPPTPSSPSTPNPSARAHRGQAHAP
jgi:hypothetical protein